MIVEPNYSYKDPAVLIHEEYEGYEQTLEDLREGLANQASMEELEVYEVREQDDWIEVPNLQNEEQLGSVSRYRIDDDIEQRAVYIFDHHEGILVIGDSAMVACAGDLGLAPLMEGSLEKN